MSTDTDYRLVVIGSGPLKDTFHAEAQRIVPGRVLLQGHIGSRTELAKHYSACDVFVHPNPKEPFGIAPLEAMASGVPIVAPNTGGVLSYLNAANSWLSKPDSQAFAAAVRLATDTGQNRNRIEAAIKTTEAFKWDRVAPALFDLYDDMEVPD